MDVFHWAGLTLGAVICIGALVLAGRQQALTPMHVAVIAIGAVLAGVPVITMSFGPQPSFQIGQIAQAASNTNAATQTQAEAISKLNDRVTQLAGLVSKLSIATAPTAGATTAPAPGPVEGASAGGGGDVASGTSLVIAPAALPAWKRQVTAFQQAGSDVERLNLESQRLTAASRTKLAQSLRPQ